MRNTKIFQSKANKPWGIIGGGFGIYGYLPALAKLGVKKVLLPLKYRQILENRKELFCYTSIVDWVDGKMEVLQNAESLIIAVPPSFQEEIVSSFTEHKKYTYLYLEKPVATCPQVSSLIFDTAAMSAHKVRVGFNFLGLEWAEKLKEFVFQKQTKIFINWYFFANHFKINATSWKAKHFSGGGVLRFYGIHILAVLQNLGNCQVLSSTISSQGNKQFFKWDAKFIINDCVSLTLSINTASSKKSFEIISNENNRIFSMDSPFSNDIMFDNEDSRIHSLMNHLSTISDENFEYYKIYSDINSLWLEVESITQFT